MSKRKLLLADDSITIQKVVNLTFADEGIEVISVGDGNSAMDKLREDLPDLVMADVNMPGLNGYEICEKIKQSEFGNSDIPVILLVGSFEPFDEDEAKRVGADDYLTKPFQSISQLVEKVSHLLKLERNENFEETAEMFLEDDENSNSVNNSSENFDDVLRNGDPLTNDFSNDEMIQTAQVGSLPIDEAVKFDSTSEMPEIDVDNESAFSLVNPEIAEPDFKQTQPLTENDYRELSIEENSVGLKSEDGSLTGHAEPFDIQNETAKFEALDTDKIDESQTHPENENFADNSDIPMPEAASILQLDEINLLDLPPLEGFGDQSKNKNDRKADELNASEKVSVVVDQQEDFSEITKDIDADVSPETLNAITRQIIEKVSEKVVREIAWEVVPELAELIIKKMAKEKIKD